MPHTPDRNTLFYGDNLHILREHVGDGSVDLVYLDPPFNSNATYNVLFRSPAGERSPAQIEAFDDTWHWTDVAERVFDEVMTSGNSDAAEMLRAMRGFLGENDMMAYLAMMAVRLLELHRVLKPTGSLYLHCDPTASHYLKLLLDAIFGPTNFRSDIIWKRQTAHSDAKTKFASVTDNILFYGRSRDTKFNVVRQPLDPGYTEKFYRFVDADGRRYQLDNMAAPEGGGMSAIRKDTGRPNGWYVWKGYEPPSRGWRYSPETMARLDAEGRLHYPEQPTQRIRLKRYLDENEGQAVSNVWTDIGPLQGAGREMLGYPTQKPLALLERIIQASSNEGDLVLDPFCGCGTTIHAAQKLNRRWIGIDVTHLAVGLIQRRLRDAFPLADFDVQGVPKDIGSAQALADADKHQFQLWALSLVEAQPYKGGKKGADKGVDGIIYFKAPAAGGAGDKLTTEKAIVSVKGGAHVGDTMVKDLITTVDHEGARMGVFVTMAPPTKPMIARAAAAGLYKTAWKEYPRIQILTIAELLDGRRPDMPWLDPSVFRKATRETAPTGQGELGV